MTLLEEMELVGTRSWAPRSALQRQRGLGLCLGSQAIGLGRQDGSLKLV